MPRFCENFGPPRPPSTHRAPRSASERLWAALFALINGLINSSVNHMIDPAISAPRKAKDSDDLAATPSSQLIAMLTYVPRQIAQITHHSLGRCES